ncbi:MAG: hypothetical protein U1E51_30530, partial [Candidatus Binatia bacterium]|nr:hypothetical protein [Candidatus Binatia bacterium]
MRKLEYTLSFTTPAFLGNAEQQAQWRTPPFKALIRQWWRVAKSPSVTYDVFKLRAEESKLFGSASDTESFRSGRSRIAIRLSSWNRGAMDRWQASERVRHPEVGRDGMDIGADLYLGYGPLTSKGPDTALSTVRGVAVQRTAINPKAEISRLTLGVPDEDLVELRQVLQLIASFGTLGSRSRNGWGSLDIRPSDAQLVLSPLNRSSLEQWNVSRAFMDCLKLEWPHAIGTDENGPLVWKTKTQSADWRPIIKELARIKIQFRTQFGFPSDGPSPSKRHVLAYPVTHHQVGAWGNQARLG